MATNDLKYTHSKKEFEEMRFLLTKSYVLNRKPLNWRLAMAENWNHASRFLEPLEFFTSRVHLWRNDAGGLAGFIIRDNFLVYPQVQYGCRGLEAEMFDWAEYNWGGDKAEINTMVYGWDHDRQILLTQRGYENRGAIEDVRIYDLTKTYPKESLPPEFRITSMAEFGDSKARIDLENSVWGATLDEAWFRGKSSAPSYSPNWDLMLISPDGKPVAASLVWLYPEYQSAEIDPLGTHPKYRKRGLARALVLESFKRMRSSGMHYAYIASFAQNPIVSQFYASLQPMETYQGFHWNKQLC